MNEMKKTRAIWGLLEKSALVGTGIDIGYGGDPVMPDAKGFDIADGDANHITDYVNGTFDYVFSSHCLEHMEHPSTAIREWWKLIKPGGYLFFIVPDEDLYEQGHWPSIYNPDHKWTFTIAKSKSWSPKSINVFNLAQSFHNGKIVDIVLQDNGYNRRLVDVDQTRGEALAQIQCIIHKRA